MRLRRHLWAWHDEHGKDEKDEDEEDEGVIMSP